jgi:hypothetical protein
MKNTVDKLMRLSLAVNDMPKAKSTRLSRRIDVAKSAYHHLSQPEIASDNPCPRHLFGNSLVFSLNVTISTELRFRAECSR